MVMVKIVSAGKLDWWRVLVQQSGEGRRLRSFWSFRECYELEDLLSTDSG